MFEGFFHSDGQYLSINLRRKARMQKFGLNSFWLSKAVCMKYTTEIVCINESDYEELNFYSYTLFLILVKENTYEYMS